MKPLKAIALAAAFWMIMFSPWTASRVNFWITMVLSLVCMIAYALSLDISTVKKSLNFRTSYIFIGLASAIILYFIFLAGYNISLHNFGFAQRSVASIYSTKSQADTLVIGLALLLWIGPAEELFWRGYIQPALGERLGLGTSVLVTALVYALVHIWALNLMLICAALVCGLFWGAMMYKFKSVVPGMISHAVWDLLIFIIIPIN